MKSAAVLPAQATHCKGIYLERMFSVAGSYVTAPGLYGFSALPSGPCTNSSSCDPPGAAKQLVSSCSPASMFAYALPAGGLAPCQGAGVDVTVAGASGGALQQHQASVATRAPSAWSVDGLTTRLAAVALSLSSRCGKTLSVLQVWRSTLGPNLDSLVKQGSDEVAVLPAYQLPYVHDQRLAGFVEASRSHGITGKELGTISQVWSKGALQVVQNVAGVPADCHPRTKLQDGAAAAVGEALYIPVYEQVSPLPHVVAVFELLVAASSSECMVVANVISAVSDLLSQVQLSVSRPAPAPVATPTLRAPVYLQQQQLGQPEATPASAGSSSGSMCVTATAVIGQPACSAGGSATTAGRGSPHYGVASHTPSAWNSNPGSPARGQARGGGGSAGGGPGSALMSRSSSMARTESVRALWAIAGSSP